MSNAKKNANVASIAAQGKGAPFVNREDCTVLVNITQDGVVRKYELNQRFEHPAECFEARSVIIAAGKVNLDNWTLVEERPEYRERGITADTLAF